MPARNGNGPPKWAILTRLSPGEGLHQQVLEITLQLYTTPENDLPNLIQMALTIPQTAAVTKAISPARLCAFTLRLLVVLHKNRNLKSGSLHGLR